MSPGNLGGNIVAMVTTLTDTMIAALEYHARIDTGEDLSGLAIARPKVATNVALMDRDLITAASAEYDRRHQMTEKGRRTAAELFPAYQRWLGQLTSDTHADLDELLRQSDRLSGRWLADNNHYQRYGYGLINRAARLELEAEIARLNTRIGHLKTREYAEAMATVTGSRGVTMTNGEITVTVDNPHRRP